MKLSFVDVTNWFGGKSTFFVFWFFVAGVYLAVHDKLTAQYIAMAGALQTLVALRSVAGDYHDRNSNGNGKGGNGNAAV